MKKYFAQLLTSRFGLIYALLAVVLTISFLTRLSILFYSREHFPVNLDLVLAFFVGIVFDIVSFSYFIIPVVLFLILVKNQWVRYKAYHLSIYIFLQISFLFYLIVATSELFFWDEFNTRFNFIAVDYLVYTNEVVGNIVESYPVALIVVAWVSLLVLFAFVTKRLHPKISIEPTPMRARMQTGSLFLLLPFLSFLFLPGRLHFVSDNQYINELGGNGLYELFAAYRNNELDYDQFYSTTDVKKAFSIVRKQLQTNEVTFASGQSQIERWIDPQKPEIKRHVSLISVESLSASFLGSYGNTKNITPNLDSIAKMGMLFTNLYATGTRTVRGLEALSLCIPPTPGQAIVRRPDNQNLFTIGSIFRSKGYETKYIYGGYSYFDNMKDYFEHNAYDVLDRTFINEDSIHYENIWGVADEDLFTFALTEINRSVEKGKTVFSHIMTTSNHRPFTYPEGRIDIPSHTGREGAVKYTDYAIGKFLRKASKESWFNQTVFVIVADHCASSAGKTELPIDKYKIPLIVYAPGLIEPSVQNTLMSQIDVGPTLLGLLHFKYKSRFMGIDIFKSKPEQQRVFISTYQKLGFIKDNHLTILEPRKGIHEFEIQPDLNLKKVPVSSVSEEAIAWYQTASYMYKHHMINQF